ncbi:MAG TPA: response regulator transcription factor [Candidatus Binatia bacterium]|nr:response regulator transcription factor [Candidatus Binatia bacterium]
MDYYPGYASSLAGDCPERLAVLLVDDHPAVLEAVMEIIETDDTLTVVATATSVSEAIRKARTWRPDVAVVDVNMPDGGGWAAARGLLDVCPRVRLVAYSAFDAALVTRTLAAPGISAFVPKGSDINLLLDAIRGGDVMPVASRPMPPLHGTAAVA